MTFYVQMERLEWPYKISFFSPIPTSLLDRTEILLNFNIVSTRYKADKKMMLEQIEEQKKRESEYTKLRKSRGELMMNIRAAIQNMLAMLVPITATETMKVGKKTQKETIDKKLAQEKSKKGQVEKDEGKFDKELQETRVIPKFDTDGKFVTSLNSQHIIKIL